MSLRNVIALSFVFLVIYGLSIIFNWTMVALMAVSLSPLLIIWVVFRVLKDPHPSHHTFDDRFYEDYDYRRNR